MNTKMTDEKTCEQNEHQNATQKTVINTRKQHEKTHATQKAHVKNTILLVVRSKLPTFLKLLFSLFFVLASFGHKAAKSK